MGSGAGLGISICKQLVGLMKGALPPTELGLGLGLRLGLALGLALGPGLAPPAALPGRCPGGRAPRRWRCAAR